MRELMRWAVILPAWGGLAMTIRNVIASNLSEFDLWMAVLCMVAVIISASIRVLRGEWF